jgi:formate/nitrite transporter FocA (FNT family)
MNSDVPAENLDEEAPKKAAAQILKHEIEEGMHALERPSGSLFISALSAGLDVGFSLFLMAVMLTHADGVLPEPVVKILVANMYAVGFIFVIVGRSELFTEQTSLAVLPLLRGRTTLAALARLWSIVYVGNLIGAAISAAIFTYIAPELRAARIESFGIIAHRMTDHPALAMFLSAVLAGWLMGLLSWIVSAVRDTISQVVLIGLVTTAIGFGGLHHVVLGSVEVLGGVFSHQGLALADFGRFLLWTTLGNAAGGSIFVALVKYGHASSPNATE